MTVVSVYAIFADAAEAERIGRTVVEERLAACDCRRSAIARSA